MVIVGDNLKHLIEQHKIVDKSASYDQNSITLTLDYQIIKITPPETEVISYGNEIQGDWITKEKIGRDGFVLSPHEAILACSFEVVRIPQGYFGMLQTKGSLARLFISIHCSDSQIEAGFEGKITFEICNFSNSKVRLRPQDKVAQLFMMKTSTRSSTPYKGRYQGATGPIIQLPEK